MSSPKYQRMQEDVPISQSPPHYSKIQPGLPKTPPESAHCADCEKSPIVPAKDRPVDDPERTASEHIPVLQKPQTVVFVPAELVEEPDYIGFSIVAALCCFLPLGIAAFVFSKLTFRLSSALTGWWGVEGFILLMTQTQKANREGNRTAARRYSRTAVILALLSLVIGLPLLIFYFIFITKSH